MSRGSRKRKRKYKERGQKRAVRYICSSCGEQEDIPQEVLEHFDGLYPPEPWLGPHRFICETCGKMMYPEGCDPASYKEPEDLLIELEHLMKSKKRR